MISQSRAPIMRRTEKCWVWQIERKARMPVEPSNQNYNRRLRLGMVGGGPGAFIGAVHRIAARLDDRYELVAAALSSNPERSRTAASDLHIAPDRAYGSFI